MLKLSIPFAEQLLAVAKTALNGNCQLHVFAGPVPPTADAALDMVSSHTALVTISGEGNGSGLQFDDVQNGVFAKAANQAWSGTITFEGAQASENAITPTFYRLCMMGDNGRDAAASSGKRIQGTAGGPTSGADLQFLTAQMTSGGSQPVGAFTVSFE